MNYQKYVPPYITIFAFQGMMLKGDYYTCHEFQMAFGGFSGLLENNEKRNMLKLYNDIGLIYYTIYFMCIL